MKIQSFINGMLAGMVIGILCAPSSGVETRRRISKKVKDFRESLTDARDVTRQRLEDTMDNLKRSEEEEIQEVYQEVKGE